MKYRIDFKEADTAFYQNSNSKPLRVRIISVDPQLSLDEMYLVEVITSGHPVYTKRHQFRTSGNWLRKTTPKKPKSAGKVFGNAFRSGFPVHTRSITTTQEQ